MATVYSIGWCKSIKTLSQNKPGYERWFIYEQLSFEKELSHEKFRGV